MYVITFMNTFIFQELMEKKCFKTVSLSILPWLIVNFAESVKTKLLINNPSQKQIEEIC